MQTASAAGLVDPTLASFAAEQVFAGELVSISVGDIGSITPNNSAMCWAAHGLLPADAFVLSPATLPVPTMSVATLPVQTCAEAPKGLTAQTLGGTNAAVLPPAASVPTPEVAGDEPNLAYAVVTTTVQQVAKLPSAPTHAGLPLVSVPSDLEGRYDDFDEALDGATVWPTAGRRNSPAPLVPQVIVVPGPTYGAETSEPARSEKLSGLSTHSWSSDLPKTTTPDRCDEAELLQTDLHVDSWEPPAPEPSSYAKTTPKFDSITSHLSPPILPITSDPESGTSVSTAPTASSAPGVSVPPHASETMTWGGPASNAARMPELDSSELTIMAGDLARIRRTFVEVAPTSDEPAIGTLIGVYCRGGHFTDSRSQRCLFCSEETDLDTMTSAAAPLLGVLAFDDNRVTPVTGLVLVGRKPSTNDPAITAVAFGEDMMLSRVHFEVRLVDWDVSVVDKQSANGTQIEHPDGRRIVARPNIEVRLEPGSIVRFGNHQATFRRS